MIPKKHAYGIHITKLRRAGDLTLVEHLPTEYKVLGLLLNSKGLKKKRQKLTSETEDKLIRHGRML